MADDLATTTGATLLVIMNMHPIVNSLGAGPTVPSAEKLWDAALSRGRVLWGVASDDLHQLKMSVSSTAGTAGAGAGPGRGWIVVRTEQLTADHLCAALERGDFYASTGVELRDYQVTDDAISIDIRTDDRYEPKYRVQFIGASGAILLDTIGTTAGYTFRGAERYVRARVTDSNGSMDAAPVSALTAQAQSASHAFQEGTVLIRSDRTLVSFRERLLAVLSATSFRARPSLSDTAPESGSPGRDPA